VHRIVDIGDDDLIRVDEPWRPLEEEALEDDDVGPVGVLAQAGAGGGTALQYERYEVLGEENGFVKTRSGYISADYVEIRDCLNEARKQDLRAMVLNMYDNLGVSEVTGYLNIREEPKEDGKIITFRQ